MSYIFECVAAMGAKSKLLMEGLDPLNLFQKNNQTSGTS
jgi:hypothetical protein